MERYDITIQMLGVEASGPQYVWEKVPAEEGELVLHTDAQATIAALQARVKELEARQHFGACAKCLTNAWRICKEGTPDAVEMKCSNGSTWWLCDYCSMKIRLAETYRIAQDSENERIELKAQLTQRTAEFQRHDGELQQICGQALGYPWFKDDQKNFPGATEKGGVCVGEHVGITIAQELANAYRKRTAELEALKIHCAIVEEHKVIAYKDAANLQAELERVRGELVEAKDFLNTVTNDLNETAKERDDLRTLVLALPKAEGAVVVSNGYVKDSTRCHALFGADEDAASYAALLQHRQRVEG